MKQDMENTRGEARRNFEGEVKKAEQEAKALEMEKGAKVPSLLGDLETFLLAALKVAA
ncbi:hypothetical protein HC823_01680 [Candidatus Gracilibacteria bacterium]|nr:hypothetical protein [Candidatus Gracilibacteria bacterium]